MLELHHASNSRPGRVLWLLGALPLPENVHMIGALSGMDSMLGHACPMPRHLGCMPEDMTHPHVSVNRVEARPAFDKAIQT